MRISCLLFGHQVGKPCAHRGADLPSFRTGGAVRIRHVISCFLGGHNYVPVCEREHHQEYRCVDCGHPLMFRVEANPFGAQDSFIKKVRYLCNLLGHAVHRVTERNSLHEYACNCGHTFLKPAENASRITHPLICLFIGHLVTEISCRNDLSELLCQHCGHTFLVKL